MRREFSQGRFDMNLNQNSINEQDLPYDHDQNTFEMNNQDEFPVNGSQQYSSINHEKASRSVRDSKDSIGSRKQKATPKKQYMRNKFENNINNRIQGGNRNYQLKGPHITKLEKLRGADKSSITVKKLTGSDDQFDSAYINKLQNWYEKRASQTPGSFDEQMDNLHQLAQGNPSLNLDYRNMLAHYQAHMNNQQDQSEFFKHLQSSDSYDFKNPVGLKNLSLQKSNKVNLPSIAGAAQINVHQHFNQPNIMNLNHNSYYVSDIKSTQEPPNFRKTSLQGDIKRGDAKSHGGHVKKKKRLVQPMSYENQLRKLRNKTGGQDNINHEDRPNQISSGTMGLQGIKEDEGSTAILNLQDLASGDGMFKDSSVLDQAINAQAKFFNQRQLAQKALKKGNQSSYFPSNFNKNSGPTLNRNPYDKGFQSLRSHRNMNFSPGNNPYKIYHNKHKKGRFPMQQKFGIEGLQREDLLDQLILAKSQFNEANDDLTKTKTRNAILQQQLKEKDKFIDELLKSTYLMNQALVSNNQMLSDGKTVNHGDKTSQQTLGDMNDPSSAYAQLMEKGPYSVLKLKKKVQDLKEMLQNKNYEYDELQRSLKQKKINEMQRELRIYVTQCKHLQGIALSCLDVLRKNGFDKEIDQHPEWNQVLSKNLSDHVPQSMKEGSPARENAIYAQLLEENVNLYEKLETIDAEKSKPIIKNLKNERTEWMQMNQKKNEQIKVLEDKIRKLQRHLGKGPYTDKQKKNDNRSASQSSADSKKRNDNSTNFKEFYEMNPDHPKNLNEKLENIEKERDLIQSNLENEKSMNALMTQKIQQLEKEAQKAKQNNVETARKEDAKAQEEKSKLQKQVDRQANEIKALNTKLKEQQKQASVSQTKTISTTQVNTQTKQELDKLTKTNEQLKKQMDDQKRQINTFGKRIIDKDKQIADLETKLAKAVSTKQSETSYQVANLSQREVNQKEKSTKPVGIQKPQQSKEVPTKTRSQTEVKKKANQLSEQEMKKKLNLPSNKEKDRDSEEPTSIVNSTIEEEQEMIEDKLKNVRMTDYEERSDMDFSQMQSVIPGVTGSEISGIPSNDHKRVSVYNNKNDTIKEEVENEMEQSFNHLQKIEPKGSGQKSDNANNYLSIEDTRHVSTSEVVVNRQRGVTVAQKNAGPENQLINQLDAIPSESRISDSVRGSEKQTVPRGSFEQVDYIELDNKSVQLGFKRLGRILQIKRLPLDQIEKIIFGTNNTFNSISIRQLKDIFQLKLALQVQDATNLARFLVEEKDDDNSQIQTIEFDPDRKTNCQYVPVRLMTQFKEYPAIYTEQQEEEIIKKFSKSFEKSKAVKLVKNIEKLENAIVPFEEYNKQVQNLSKKDQLTKSDIECSYIYLCRGPPSNRQITDQQLAEQSQGFDSQNARMLFEELEAEHFITKSADSENYSEDMDNYEDDKIDESIVQSKVIHGSEDYQEDFNEEIISDGEDKINKSAQIDSQIISKDATAKFAENGEKEERFMTDEKKTNKKPDINAADFTFKSKESLSLDQPKKADRYDTSQDRSDDDLDQQESMSPDQILKANKVQEKIKIQDEKALEKIEDKEEIGDDYEDDEKPKEVVKQEDLDVNIKQASHILADNYVIFWFEKDNSSNMQRCLSNLKQARFNVYKTKSVGTPDENAQVITEPKDKEKEIICIFNKTNAKEAIDLIEQNNEQYKVGVLFDANNDISDCKYHETHPDLVVGKANNLYKLAEILNEANSKLYDEKYKDGPVRGQRRDQVDKEVSENSYGKEDDKTKPNEEEEKKEQPNDDQPTNNQDDPNAQYEYYDEEDEGEAEPNGLDDNNELEPSGNKTPPRPEEQEEEKKDADLLKLEKVPDEDPKVTLLNEALFQILNRKMKAENLYNDINQTQVNSLIKTSSELFQQIGKSIHETLPEVVDSCRDIFREIIYSEVTQGGEFKATTSQQSLSIPIKIEVEVIKFHELIDKFEELIQPEKLTEQQITCIQIIFTLKNHNNMIKYNDISEAFNPLEIRDFKTPKGQKTSNQINYDLLDLRSIRLINRMIHYLGSQQVSFTDFMKDIIQMQVVKTKGAENPNVEIFLAKKFFQKLYDHGIKKTALLHPNLCIFLCIDQKYKNYLMLKKLKRMIIDFGNSAYFQSVGLKKTKIEAKEGDYEYYDEEADETEEQRSVQNMPQAPKSVVDDLREQNSSMNKSQNSRLQGITLNQGSEQALPDLPTKQSNSQLQQVNTAPDNNAEYEYYDEEDPEANEEAANAQAKAEEQAAQAKMEEQAAQVKMIQAQAQAHASLAQQNSQKKIEQQTQQPLPVTVAPALAVTTTAVASNIPANAPPGYVPKYEYGDEYYDEEDDGATPGK